MIWCHDHVHNSEPVYTIQSRSCFSNKHLILFLHLCFRSSSAIFKLVFLTDFCRYFSFLTFVPNLQLLIDLAWFTPVLLIEEFKLQSNTPLVFLCPVFSLLRFRYEYAPRHFLLSSLNTRVFLRSRGKVLD